MQIRTLKSRLTISCVFTVVGLLVGTYSYAQDLKPVVVATVVEAEVKSGQRVVGTVKPLRVSTIGSAADGRVEYFYVNQGDSVEQGQPLAQLRTGTLEIEKSAAEAEVELAAQRLAELENGNLPEEIAEAEANMRAAEATLTNAQTQLKRMQSLATNRAASSSELDDATERADAAKFALKATKALLQRMQDGPRPEMIAQAKAQLELQRQRLNLIKDRIAKFTIVAPFNGFVSAEFTEVGSWIQQGDAVAEVIQMDEVEIEAAVTAEAVVNLRKGDVIRVEFPELPNELLTGTIDRIVPQATSRARTYPVQIRLKNRMVDGTPMLLSGMLARVDLPAGKREKLPLVPKDALVLNGDDRSIYVVEPDPKGTETLQTGVVRKVAIRLGVAVQDKVQVHGDIRPGDRVVVVGNERLIPKTKVNVVQEVK